jgi:regulator of replication initiation timing
MEPVFYAFIGVIFLSGQIMLGILLYQWNTGFQQTLNLHSEVYEIREFTNKLYDDNRLLAQELNKLREDFDLRELYGEDSSVYFEAIKKARNGASLDDLISEYGIDKNEADLIIHTHQPIEEAA